MKSEIKTAVIGVGNMGKNHARVYSEISNLVAVVDKNKEMGEQLALQYNCKYYNDFEEMIQEQKPQAISVVVPTTLHRDIVISCLKKSIPVLVEKPIADTLDNAQSIIDAASQNKTLLFVGHIERHNPAVKKVKKIIDSGKLGKIISIVTKRVGGFPSQIRDVSIAIDLAIHDIDIVNFLLDSEPEEIYVNNKKNHLQKRADSAEFYLVYKDSSAFIQANWITPVKIRKLYITGTDGYLEMDYITQKIIFYKSIYEKFMVTDQDFSDYVLKFSDPEKIEIYVTKKEPLKEEIKYFLSCVKKGRREDPGYALTALKIALTN